jgi:hypothetical protein
MTKGVDRMAGAAPESMVMMGHDVVEPVNRSLEVVTSSFCVCCFHFARGKDSKPLGLDSGIALGHFRSLGTHDRANDWSGGTSGLVDGIRIRKLCHDMGNRLEPRLATS